MTIKNLASFGVRSWLPTAVVFSAVLIAAPTASAQGWKEEPTALRFSEPVVIPGATLAPGTYQFRLVDPDAMQSGIRITADDGNRLVATIQAVPITRETPTDSTVLAFARAEGQPPALKAWFYPGTTYGHEFVYPDEEARQIAERDKTVVLSVGSDDGEVDGGIIYQYDAAGSRSEWRGDPEVLREWREWLETMPEAADDEMRPSSDEQSGGPAGE